MINNTSNIALDEPPLTDSRETLDGSGGLAALSADYLNSILVGEEGTPEEIDPLRVITLEDVTLHSNPGDRLHDQTHNVEIPIDQQLEYVAQVKNLLGEQATFGVKPTDLKGDSQNIKWMGTLGTGNWPVDQGGELEGHDRTNHFDSLIYSPPEQAMLVITATDYALAARQAGQDIIIPAHYTGSKRGANHDSNLWGHIDNSTEGLGDLSEQTLGLLAPLLDKSRSFEDLIKENTAVLTQDIEDFLDSPAEKTSWSNPGEIYTGLSLALGCLDLVAQACQDRHATDDEIKIALYEVIKGYVRTAAKLRDEPVPAGALDFWPTDQHGTEMTMTMGELLFELEGGDRQVLDPRL